MSKERWLTGTYLVQLRGCINTSKNKMEHHPARPPQVKSTASESKKHTCYSSPRRAVWWKCICLLLSKTLPGIIFSFFTSWEGERKSRNGYPADVLKRTWSSGKMPEPESKEPQQTHTETPQKVRVCKLWLDNWGQLLPSSLPWLPRLKSVIVRELSWEWNKPCLQNTWQRGWRAHSMEAQITVMFYYYQHRQFMPKLKAHSTKAGKGIPWQPCQWKRDIYKSRVYKLGVVCNAIWKLFSVWFHSRVSSNNVS